MPNGIRFADPSICEEEATGTTGFLLNIHTDSPAGSPEVTISVCFTIGSLENFMVNKDFATSLDQSDPIEPSRNY